MTLPQEHEQSVDGSPLANAQPPRIFMMDLLATVPYYTAYLSRALLAQRAELTVGSISYYLDPGCFSSRGIPLRPGLLNVVGRYPLPARRRRVLKLLELGLNLSALTLRFLLRPPDVLHIQFLPLLRWPVPLDLWFVTLLQRRGSKLVLTVHDLLPHDTGEQHRATFLQLYQQVDTLICHSDHVKARLETEFGMPASKVSVIPHGPFFYDQPASATSDLRERFGIPADHKIVLWQGIIFPYKGLDLLLEAWQQVQRRCGNAHLVVLGTGSPVLLTRLHEQVRLLQLRRVTLDLRFVSSEELLSAYRAADIVVYPYRAITTSGALATGLALGKAIVATDLPVFRELLINGENALLVAPGDTTGLASALCRLIDDDALRARFMDTVGALNFGSQAWISIADKTLEVYTSVLDLRSKNAAASQG